MFSIEAARKILAQVDTPLTLLEGLFVHSPIGVQLYGADGHSLFVNQAFFDIFKSVPPPDYNVLKDEIAVRTGLNSIIAEAFAGKVSKMPVTWYDPRELEHVTVLEGRRVAIETFLIPICGPEGRVKYVVFLFRDVTPETLLEIQKEEALKKLREANDLIDNLMNGTEAVIYAKNLDSRLLFVNRQYGKVVGRDPQSLIGLSLFDVHPAETAAAMRAHDVAALSGAGQLAVEETVTHPDGSVHEYLSLKFPLKDSEGKAYGVCGISTDISRVRRLEKELSRARRMEALGLLAGGVAHDFNNLLAMILLHTESLALHIPEESSEARKDLSPIRLSIERASALVRQLLAFGRRLPMHPRAVDLNVVVRDLSYMITKLAGEAIDLELAPSPEPCLAKADPALLEQVLLNLCMNAKDAIAGSGRIWIRTGHETLTPGRAGLKLASSAGPYVFLEVEDNGQGMEPEVLERAIEPFFTTKELGAGSGLGLAAVFGIVQENRGNLLMRTAPGEGCVIRVYFPEENLAVSPAPAESHQPSGGRTVSPAKVLLVEDEPLLREITAQRLRQHGFQVLEAAHAREVPALLAEHRDVKLLISDVVMPGKSGPALVKELEASGLLKGVGVVFVSGYSRDELGSHGFSSPYMHLLEKPFSTEALLAKIDESLRGVTR